MFVRRSLFALAILGLNAASLSGQEYDLTAEQLGTLPPPAILAHAKHFALKHQGLPAAARAGLDWYIAATALGHEEETKAARMFLLLEHPKSTAGAFIYRSFTDDALLSKTLLEEFNREDRNLDTPFLTRYLLATLFAPQSQAAAARQNLDFLLSYIYALQSGGYNADHELVVTAQRHVRQLDAIGEKTRLLDLLLAKNVSVTEKFSRLQEFNDHAVARAIQRGLFLRLQIQERVGPAEMRLHARNLLAGHKWQDALVWLEKMPATSADAQTRFWHGWCLAALGKADEAIPLLESLQRDEPEDDWGKQGAQLLATLRGHDERLKSLAKTLSLGISEWRTRPPEAMEAHLVVLGENGNQVLGEGYLGIDASRSHFEVVVLREGKMVAAYRTVRGHATTYVAGRSEITTFARGGVIPHPWLRFEESADGKYQFHFGVKANENIVGDLSALVNALLESPVFANEDSIYRCLKQSRSYGSFLAATPATERKLVWETPLLDKPGFDRLAVKMGDDGKVESVHTSTARLEHIRYGQADTFTLKPPAWPDLPEREMEVFPPGELFSLAGAAMEAVTEVSRLSKAEKGTGAKPR